MPTQFDPSAEFVHPGFADADIEVIQPPGWQLGMCCGALGGPTVREAALKRPTLSKTEQDALARIRAAVLASCGVEVHALPSIGKWRGMICVVGHREEGEAALYEIQPYHAAKLGLDLVTDWLMWTQWTPSYKRTTAAKHAAEMIASYPSCHSSDGG